MSATMQAPQRRQQNNEFKIQVSDAEIMARVAKIKRSWSREEKQQRAEAGRHRRNVLAALVESVCIEDQDCMPVAG